MNEDSSKKKTRKKTARKKEEKIEIQEPPVKRVKYDSRADTYQHMQEVQANIFEVIKRLTGRAICRDASKLEDPEKELFDKWTPMLKELEYGSEEYKAALEKLGPALQHHYAKNSHHPEHYPNGIDDMTIMDIVEMFCDWKAATQRMHDGNIRKSLEINKERFEMSEQLYKIFENTVKELGW
jgi:hypothetical protein